MRAQIRGERNSARRGADHSWRMGSREVRYCSGRFTFDAIFWDFSFQSTEVRHSGMRRRCATKMTDSDTQVAEERDSLLRSRGPQSPDERRRPVTILESLQGISKSIARSV